MKALVIGGNGFIGSHLVDELLRRDWDVAVMDISDRRYDPVPPSVHFIRGDITQAYILREALIGMDVVFHLAWSTIHEVSNADPSADVHSNLIPSIHLIEACKRAGIRRFVFTSSGGTVYGPSQNLPIPETHENNPVTGYGITKLGVEKYLHMFNHLFGFDYVVLRPSVPYGPHQNPLGRQGAVAVFLYRVAHHLPVSVWGDGSVTRDYFYISDLVNALVASAVATIDNQRIFNIGGGKELSIKNLITLVVETVGEQAVIQYLPERRFDAPRLLLDIRLANTYLDWQPLVDIHDGLEKTWTWMQTQIKS